MQKVFLLKVRSKLSRTKSGSTYLLLIENQKIILPDYLNPVHPKKNFGGPFFNF
jgi:hypothetical protein